MNLLKTVLSLLFFLISTSVTAQSYSDISNLKSGNYDTSPAPILGLWEVLKVTVGAETLTPIAKWFEINDDGTMISGNGWLQNFSGSFNYNQDTRELLQASNGTVDEYGAFKVRIEGTDMTWKRFEDGQPVEVTLVRIDKKPLAPWDLITGNWFVQEQSLESNQDNHIVDGNFIPFASIYLGWDRRYRKFDEENKRIETGIWHIESHSNWIWLISDKDNAKSGFSIEMNNKSLRLTHKTELQTLNIQLTKEN